MGLLDSELINNLKGGKLPQVETVITIDKVSITTLCVALFITITMLFLVGALIRRRFK
jgi:hypothetical protein